MGPQDDYIETVLTCEGDYYDPDFPKRLEAFKQNLQGLLLKDEQSIILKKVEPWNSVRVTINIPKEAALRLKQLAETRDPSLRDIGILAVQIEGDNVISLTLAGKNNETTELVFRTCDGPSPGIPMGYGSTMPGVGPSSAGRDILNLLGHQRSTVFDGMAQQQSTGMPAFKLPSVVSPQSEVFPIPAAIRGQTVTAGHSSNVMSNNAISPQKNAIGYPALSSSASHVQSFPAPALSRNAGKPKGPIPKLPHFPLNPQGPFQSLQPPPPYPGGTAVNNVPHSMMMNKGAIPTSSQLLVTLLQNEMAAAGTSSNAGAGGGGGSVGHVNNFQIKKTPLPSPVKDRVKEKEPEAANSPQTKRRRKNKPKDGTKAPARNYTKVDSATRDKFIAHMDDIFSDVIGEIGPGSSNSGAAASSSVPTTSTTAMQNNPLLNAASVNTVMERNLPGFEPKVSAGDGVTPSTSNNSSGVVLTVDRTQQPSMPSCSDNQNGPERQNAAPRHLENRELVAHVDSLDRMIINPYTGQLEPIDSIEDGTIVRQDDEKFDHRSADHRSSTATSTSATTTTTNPKAAVTNDMKIVVSDSNNIQQKLCHNPTPCLTAADARHVPPFSSIASIINTSLSESMISPSVNKTDVSSSPVIVASASHQVGSASSHPPPLPTSSTSCATFAGRPSIVDSVASSDKISEQRTSFIAVPVTETGYTPKVGALASSEDNSDGRSKSPVVPKSFVDPVGANLIRLPSASSSDVKSPAFVNHDSTHHFASTTAVSSSTENTPVTNDRRNSLCSSSYATSAYSSTCDSVSNTPPQQQQVVTVGCVLGQRPPDIIVSTHSSALFVPNKLSKHEHVADNVMRRVSSELSVVTTNSDTYYSTANVRNSEKDSKLSLLSSCVTSVSCVGSTKDGKNIAITTSDIGESIGRSGGPSVITTATTTSAYSASVMPRDSFPMYSANTSVPSSSCISGCDTQMSAFASTRGPRLQFHSETGIKLEGENLIDLPGIPPAVTAKLQPGPLLMRPELGPATLNKESRIVDGHKKLVSGLDTVMTHIGHVQTDTPSPMLQRPIMSTSVSMRHHHAGSGGGDTIRSSYTKPQDMRISSSSISSHCVVDSVNTGGQSVSFGASSAGLDHANSSSSSSTLLSSSCSSSPSKINVVTNADVVISSASNPVHNCNDSHVSRPSNSGIIAAAVENKLEIKSSSQDVRKTDSNVTTQAVWSVSTEFNKVPNLVTTDKTAHQHHHQQQHHKKGISIMKPMLDRDADIMDEVKHLPLISDLQKTNVLKSDLKVNSTVMNAIVGSNKTTMSSKNVLNIDKILEASGVDQPAKNKSLPSTGMDVLAQPLSQLNTLTKAVVGMKDSLETTSSSGTSPGRSVSPRNSVMHNPTRSVHDINFYNSSLHPITAPIFPFNLTQSVKKVVGPIPSSDTTKPAKLKMAGTSPPRSASPRGSKVSLHNVSHMESLAKSSSIASHSTSSVSAVNLSSSVRNDAHSYMSTVRSTDAGMFHHAQSGKTSQRRGSSPKALGLSGGPNQPMTLPPLTNLAAGVPGLHMLNPRTCANNSVPFHSNASPNFHHNLSSLRPMMNPNLLNHDSAKSRNHPPSIVVSSPAHSVSPSSVSAETSYAKFVTGAATTALNLSAKSSSTRHHPQKQTTPPRRMSPVISMGYSPAVSRSSPTVGNTIGSLSRSPAFIDHVGNPSKSSTVDVHVPIMHQAVVAPDLSAVKANLPMQVVANESFMSSVKEKENGENPHLPEIEPVPKVGLMMDHAYVQRVNSTNDENISRNDLKSHQTETRKDDSNGSSTSDTPSHSSNNNTLGHALNLVKTQDPSPVKNEYDNLNAESVSNAKISTKLGEDITSSTVQLHPAKISRHNSNDRASEDNSSDISDLSESTRSLRGRSMAGDRPDSPILRAQRSGRGGRRKTPVDDLDSKSDRSESPKLARGKRKNHDELDSINPIDLKRSKMDANCLIPTSDSLNCLDSADDAEVSEMTSRKVRNVRAKSLVKSADDKVLSLHNTRLTDGKSTGGRQSRSSSRGASECGEDHITATLDVPIHGHDTRSRTRTSSRKASDECSSDGGKRADETRSRRNTSSRSRSPVHGKEKSPPRAIREKSPVRGGSRILPTKVTPPKKDPSPARDVPARRTTRSCKPKDNHKSNTSPPSAPLATVGKRRRSSREHR